MYPIICKKKKSKKMMKSKIYPPVCFAPVRIDGMLPSKVIQQQVVLVDDVSEEVIDRVCQELPLSQAAQNEKKFQAQPALNPKVSNQRAQKHWQTTELLSKDPIEEFQYEEPVESQSVSMVASIESSYQNPKSDSDANKVKIDSKGCFKFTSNEIKLPFVKYNQQYGTQEPIDVRTMHNPIDVSQNPIEVSQPCYQSPCVNQTQGVYPYIRPTPKYTGNGGPAMTFDIHNCMQTTQLRLIHENIKLSKENETLKKNAEVDQKIIMMLRSNIQTLNYILSKKPYKQQQISSDLQLFSSQQDYGQ